MPEMTLQRSAGSTSLDKDGANLGTDGRLRPDASHRPGWNHWLGYPPAVRVNGDHGGWPVRHRRGYLIAIPRATVHAVYVSRRRSPVLRWVRRASTRAAQQVNQQCEQQSDTHEKQPDNQHFH